MPTYVYRRPDGTAFEVFQKISDAPLTEDPETGEPVQRVISGGAGLQFKGDGFYLTDYVRKPGKEDGGEKKEGAKETASDDTKEAAKPAEKKGAPAPSASASSDG